MTRQLLDVFAGNALQKQVRDRGDAEAVLCCASHTGRPDLSSFRFIIRQMSVLRSDLVVSCSVRTGAERNNGESFGSDCQSIAAM